MDILHTPFTNNTSTPQQYEPATLAFTEGTLDVPRTSEENFQLPPAMLEAAPTDEFQRKAYMVGALAATQRREHPVAAPTAFDELHNLPNFDRSIEVKHLPEAASVIVEAIRERMPDAVIAADRGGRMIALAAYQVWRQRYPGVPFPTIDGKIHFGRISKTPAPDYTRDTVQHILNRSGVMAEMAMRRAEGDERPAKVLLLDDWIGGGSTMTLAREHIEAHLKDKLDFVLATMAGRKHDTLEPHIVGKLAPDLYGASWSDDSDCIGVCYSRRKEGNPLYNEPYHEESGIWPLVLPSIYMRRLRQQLAEVISRQVLRSPHPYPAAEEDK